MNPGIDKVNESFHFQALYFEKARNRSLCLSKTMTTSQIQLLEVCLQHWEICFNSNYTIVLIWAAVYSQILAPILSIVLMCQLALWL